MIDHLDHLVLTTAHVLAREEQDRPAYVYFAWAGFFCFGLTLRALMTGLGVGMKAQLLTRARGPTRYQPLSGPIGRRNGNFMYDQDFTSSTICSQ